MTFAVAAAAAVIVNLAEPLPAARVAGSPLEVSLDVDRCAFLSRDHIFQLVALELDARVVTPDRAGEQTTRVEVACAGTEVQLNVSDRLTGKLLTRTMMLGERDAQVGTRLVAIAVA